jgi:putative peptidoglycan lipid II flippase
MEFPTALLGVALGTVLLPSLSKYHFASDEGEYSKLLDWGLRLTFILAAPAAVALALLSVPLVTTLFHYGRFGEHDVWMTRQALIAYSAGLLGLILVKVLAPGFYARQNIATPVRIAVLTLIATQVMNAVFVLSLKQGGLELTTGIGPHAGLALAIGLGACLNAGLLYRKLRQHGIYQPQPGWGAFALKVAVALAAMALALWLAMGSAAWWLGASGWTRAASVTGLVLLGGAAYFASLWLLGFRLGDFSRRAA